MTGPRYIRSGSPVARQNASTHLFAVGQIVRMKSGLHLAAVKPSDTYRITARLPATGDLPQYRIRNEVECHERVMTQEMLEPLTTLRAGSTLMERTFGHG